ncbi:hypothetical protein ACLF6K_39610 (plasmid) [Streptomyces xanthophaeus]|uniref:hypothetical protein n=1 Tax=Streptomyces xanthophaeus TaxID=67385 RepID=UPI00398FA16D
MPEGSGPRERHPYRGIRAPESFRLERGSTGLRHADDPPLPAVGPQTCRAAWHAAARAACGKVGDFTEQRDPQNFHSATINDRDGTHLALFHAHYALIAFVDGRRDEYTDEFLAPPAWAATLTDFGFTTLDAPLLRSPLSGADTSALSDLERKQIRYWQPETVGAVLFNSWD